MNLPPVALSTGTIGGATAVATARALVAAGAPGVELSAGDWAPGTPDAVAELATTVAVPVNLHNYFPPEADPFTLNLASADPDVAARSMAHVRGAVALSARIGAPDYGFHAGFLVDPRPEELGRPLGRRPIGDRRAGRERFVERVHVLAAEAADVGVTLMIENNVLSRANLDRFGGDPLLLTDPDDARLLVDSLPAGVGILLDVAHAKVSAATLGFEPVDLVRACEPRIHAYHLSDNDGAEDSNGPVDDGSWFWSHLRTDVARITLEVRGLAPAAYVEQARLVERAVSAPRTLVGGGSGA